MGKKSLCVSDSFQKVFWDFGGSLRLYHRIHEEELRMDPFIHLLPKSLEEACDLLSKYEKGEALVMAGGTDLIPAMKEKVVRPRCLIDLRKIDHLDLIHEDEREGLRIGALASLHSIESHPKVKEKFPILSQAAHTIGSVQIRNLGTVGGNLCHAAPSADMAPPLICLGARARIMGSRGERWVALEDFFEGPNKTVVRNDEILVEIKVPPMPLRASSIYLKHSLRKPWI